MTSDTQIAEHTVKAFDADLRDLSCMLAEMGGLTERQIDQAIEALTTRDRRYGEIVVSEDQQVDLQQQRIEQKAIETIAVRQPLAIDLRGIVGILRIARDLERIGDLAKNIGKRVIALGSENLPRCAVRGTIHMACLAAQLLHDALDSYAQMDSEKAFGTCRRDEVIDHLCASLFCELRASMMEDSGIVGAGMHFLFCIKNIERIGDHATNIAESVYYIVEGRTLKARSLIP